MRTRKRGATSRNPSASPNRPTFETRTTSRGSTPARQCGTRRLKRCGTSSTVSFGWIVTSVSCGCCRNFTTSSCPITTSSKVSVKLNLFLLSFKIFCDLAKNFHNYLALIFIKFSTKSQKNLISLIDLSENNKNRKISA